MSWITMQDPLSAGLIVPLLSPLSVNRTLLCSDDMLSHLALSSSGPAELAWSLPLMATKCCFIRDGILLVPGVRASLLNTLRHC